MEDETPPGEAVPQEITLSGGLTLPPLGVLFQRAEAPGDD